MTTTTDLHPALQEAFNNLPEPAGLTKIIILNQRDERHQIVARIFARGDGGCIIGSASGAEVHFGHPPSIETKYFVGPDRAVDYAKKLCRLYLGRDDVDFLVEEGDIPIQLAAPS